MLFKNIGILDENFEYRDGMYVGTIDDKIAYIGSQAPDDSRLDEFGEIFDGRERLLMPGFYNSHAHSPMTLLRGYGENLSLDRWLNEKIFPFEAKLYGKAVYYGTLLAMAESLRFGIVSTTDMYNFNDEIIRAVSESGAKINTGRHALCFDRTSPEDNATIKEMLDVIYMYDGFMDGRIKTDASIHAEYTSDERTVRYVAELAREHDVNIHVHVAETKLETDGCVERHGCTPVAYFEKLGVFDQRTTAAHCVWLTDEDMDILAAKKVNVASNPASNLKLDSGICDVPKLYEKGINVAIGTDGVASNNNLNFLEDVKLFAMLGKIRGDDAALMTPEQVLYSATRSGALAQGREDSGLLKEGNKADLIVMDVSAPNMQPVHSMVNNLLYSASGSDIVMTMVDGRVLYLDGEYKTIDVEMVKSEVEKARKRILESL